MLEVLFANVAADDANHERVNKIENADGFGGLVFAHLLFKDVDGVFGLFGVQKTGTVLSFLHQVT